MIKQPSFRPHALQSRRSINMIYCSSSGHSPSMVNTDLVSYCRIDLPSSHPGDDLWQNKQPFGPSSLSAVTLSMEICGLNQRSDDTQPSVVVLSVFGHEVERKHTLAEFFSFFKIQSRYKCLQTHTNTHTRYSFVPQQTHMHAPVQQQQQHTHTSSLSPQSHPS